MKVLINQCYGGFGVSEKVFDLFNARSKEKVEYGFQMKSHRADPILIDIVEELGEDANGSFADLTIADVPDEYDYWIEDYDGWETLHLSIREDHLRKLIRLGIEDDIVAYVMNAG